VVYVAGAENYSHFPKKSARCAWTPTLVMPAIFERIGRFCCHVVPPSCILLYPPAVSSRIRAHWSHCAGPLSAIASSLARCFPTSGIETAVSKIFLSEFLINPLLQRLNKRNIITLQQNLACHKSSAPIPTNPSMY
jgi:hypothetical protein